MKSKSLRPWFLVGKGLTVHPGQEGVFHPSRGVKVQVRGDKQIDRGSIGSDADSTPGCCGEEGTEPVGKALNLPINPFQTLTFWSLTVGSDQKDKTVNTKS